jgi:hypothetical protein
VRFGELFEGFEADGGEVIAGDLKVDVGGIGSEVGELREAGGAEYWGIRGWKKDRIEG